MPDNPNRSITYSPRFYYEEDDVPESGRQHKLAAYLEDLLRWLYYKENWFVTGNVPITLGDVTKSYIVPDVMLFKGLVLTEDEIDEISSWNLSVNPAPTVVFEISSNSTWKLDVTDKIDTYAAIGVQEYYAYDPLGFWKSNLRLRGWRYENGARLELEPDADGWLWSAVLDSWLVPDGRYLRLYDANGQLRLTRDEAERAAFEAERLAREAERKELQELLARLRARGIDPDTL